MSDTGALSAVEDYSEGADERVFAGSGELVTIETKRIYAPADPDDGYRLLIMRHWPRGVRKDRVDAWERGLAPTRELLADFNTHAIDWPEYERRFLLEMATRPDALAALDALRQRSRRETVTLICGCADAARCHRSLVRGLVEGVGSA